MKILATGCTGFIGSLLVPKLQELGHELVLVTRNTGKAKAKFLRDGYPLAELEKLTFEAWNPRAEPFPEHTLSGVQAVIHLMGENIAESRWTQARKEELYFSRVESTLKLTSALPDSVQHFLCASAVGIYPSSVENRYDEVSLLPGSDLNDKVVAKEHVASNVHQPKSQSFLLNLVSEWEQAAKTALMSSTIKKSGSESSSERQARRVVLMRIGIVLGQQGFLKKLLPIYSLGLGGSIGAGTQGLSWIHIQDLIESVVWVLNHKDVQGPVNLVGPAPVSFEVFSRDLAKLMGRPHLMRVPAFALNLAMGEMAEIALSGQYVLPAKLLESGFNFKFRDHVQAFHEILTAG